MTPDADTRPPLDSTRLRGLRRPLQVEALEEAPSTNAVAMERARAGAPHGTVVVAEHQSAGRGRLDRDWQAPPYAALTLSLLLRPGDVAPERWSLLPLLTGVAVAAAVSSVGGPRCELKWPNDVMHDGFKLAGLLIERTDTPQGPAAVVGIGMNVTTTRQELPVETAGSLVTAGMVDPDRTTLLLALLEAFMDRYDTWAASPASDPGLLADYRALSDTIGRIVTVSLPGGEVWKGEAVDVDPTGALLVDVAGETRAVSAGDVVHVR